MIAFRRPTTKHFFRSQTVAHVDIERFMGEWFVQGHTHLWIDRNGKNQIESYQLTDAGDIKVNFSFRKNNKISRYQQKARIADRQTNAHWHIQFVYPFWQDYLIVGLDAEYQWTLISVPNRKLMWIMTRDKIIPNEQYQILVEYFRKEGYPVEKIERIKQI